MERELIVLILLTPSVSRLLALCLKKPSCISLTCTATGPFQLVVIWIEASENTELSAALPLDQSAAYDLVDHILLLEKLRIYNFEEDNIQWFQSYLCGRSQVVQEESKLNSSSNQ